jgi:hypothetical protein
MSVNEPSNGAPIAPGSPLAQALDRFAVPELPTSFTDRVLAAAAVRPAPLPEPRRPGGGRGWRVGRRIAIGIASFGALATAAAATGLLERLEIPVPSAETVWASITGKPQVAAAAVPVMPKPAGSAPAALTRVEIVGAVDTPEELGEAFRRIDEVRQGRIENRRELIDQRINRELERRRAAGLPLPTPEEEAQFRARIDEAQARRQQLAEERITAHRTEMERKVVSGEALTREDILRPLREDQRALQRRERIEQLRRMSPEARREAVRKMPPEERRALMEKYRALRSGQAIVPAAEPAPVTPVSPPAAPEAEPTPSAD